MRGNKLVYGCCFCNARENLIAYIPLTKLAGGRVTLGKPAYACTECLNKPKLNKEV